VNFKTWLALIDEAAASRYSVEVNFRTTDKEVVENYAKITLGYVSAALKQNGYHVKQVFEESPLRIIVSARNFDDGEWAAVVTFNPEHRCFVVSKGFYNRDRKTVSVQSSTKCMGNSAAEITRELRNTMFQLKSQPDRHQEKLNPVALKRGPKK
jgi:putative SOS response-associated peptidase YedK